MDDERIFRHVSVRALQVTLLIWFAADASAAGPSAEALAYTCAGCHGTDGSSVGPSSPHIAAMDPAYFYDSMLAYKSDQRDATIMNRIAKAYTDEEIEAMAAFFAKQPLRTAAQAHDPQQVERGAELHDRYCENCHEDGGRNPEGGMLAGQWTPYLAYSMADFQSGAREMPRKMKKKLDDLRGQDGDVGIEALLHFYASQR